MRTPTRLVNLLFLSCTALVWCLATGITFGGTRTWDGKHDTSLIEVDVVYFVPADRQPLTDWQDRARYYCRRLELFHQREFDGQSRLTVTLHPTPLVSQLTTAELRKGDGDAIFFRTLQEADRRLKFPPPGCGCFPILLVLSEINWRPLDDFHRLKPGDAGGFEFEGNYNDGQHFPGAAAGGARATYLAEAGKGWGLVSADGWRVPYRGSDCVAYHEGCGHTVGLPHPEPGNGSVMSLGQYEGWLSESWLDKEQKLRLGWQPPSQPVTPDAETELYSRFRALPHPRVPKPGEAVTLALDWPEQAVVKSLRIRFQTALDGPWIEVPQQWEGTVPLTASLGTFDRPTPLSYRLDVELDNGAKAELWGYLQIRSEPGQPPQPGSLSPDLMPATPPTEAAGVIPPLPAEELDLLANLDLNACWQTGTWGRENNWLVSPRQYGARVELPHTPPAEYRLTLIVEPLDQPNGLILGQRLGDRRFVTLFNYTPQEPGQSAIENVDDRNVGNETTFTGNLFQKDRLSQVIVTVRQEAVSMSVDGRTIVNWKGKPDRLSLSDYWKTPDDTRLFIGAYDCRYRIYRITLEPLTKAKLPPRGAGAGN